MKPMKPSIGRIVHFVQNNVHYPAIIAKVWSDTCVNLFVMPNGSDRLHSGGGLYGALAGNSNSVSWASAEENKEFSWHWPEQV